MCEKYVLSGILSVLTPGETVTKLGVCKLMEPTRCCHTEVAPYVLVTTEVQLLYCTRTWLESLETQISKVS